MSDENENFEINNEALKKNGTKKVMRMYHQNKHGEYCHAFDIDYPTYLLWKSGGINCPASAVHFPDGTQPISITKVICGTCKNFPGNPKNMKTELIWLPYV